MAATPDAGWGARAEDAPPSWRVGELPYAITTSPGRVVIPPGRATTVAIRAYPLGSRTPLARFRAAPPAGITATPATGRLVSDPATGIASATVTVSVAATTAEGRYPVPIVVTSADHAALPPLAVTVLVGQPGTFAVLRNNIGITDDAGTHDEGDLDDGGVSLSRQALAAAGLAPGARTTPSGLAFTWPGIPAGQPDNIGCDRSELRLDSLPATATRLSFVGTGANGDQQGTATLRYADGSTDVIDLSFTDWTISGGRGSLQFGNEIVARTAYRNIAGSAREDVATYVFATQPVPIPAGKRVTAVTLPNNTDIHVFAVATG